MCFTPSCSIGSWRLWGMDTLVERERERERGIINNIIHDILTFSTGLIVFSTIGCRGP